MMTRRHIEATMQIHVLNLCLATATKQAGNITQAKEALYSAVEKLVREAEQR